MYTAQSVKQIKTSDWGKPFNVIATIITSCEMYDYLINISVVYRVISGKHIYTM